MVKIQESAQLKKSENFEEALLRAIGMYWSNHLKTLYIYGPWGASVYDIGKIFRFFDSLPPWSKYRNQLSSKNPKILRKPSYVQSGCSVVIAVLIKRYK